MWHVTYCNFQGKKKPLSNRNILWKTNAWNRKNSNIWTISQSILPWQLFYILWNWENNLLLELSHLWVRLMKINVKVSPIYKTMNEKYTHTGTVWPAVQGTWCLRTLKRFHWVVFCSQFTSFFFFKLGWIDGRYSKWLMIFFFTHSYNHQDMLGICYRSLIYKLCTCRGKQDLDSVFKEHTFLWERQQVFIRQLLIKTGRNSQRD